jgi:hypothetical protein
MHSSFTTYHRVCNKSNTTDVTCWTGTAYRSVSQNVLKWTRNKVTKIVFFISAKATSIIIHHFLTWFVTRVTRLMSHVEQELLTVPVHPSSPPGFRGVRFPRSLYFCVMFYRSLCPFYDNNISFFFFVLCFLTFWVPLLFPHKKWCSVRTSSYL